MPYTGQKYAMTYYGSVEFDKDSFLIAGVSFCYNTCESICIDDILYCTAEPTNEYDKNAIMIITDTSDKCGYVPKNYQKYILDNNIKQLKVINKKRHKGAYGIRVVPYITDNNDNIIKTDKNINLCKECDVDKTFIKSENMYICEKCGSIDIVDDDTKNTNIIPTVNMIDRNEEWYEFYNRISNSTKKKRINYNKIKKKYYNDHKDIYNYLYENNLYKHEDYKSSTYCIEKYITSSNDYESVSKLVQKYKYKDLKDKILPSVKYFRPTKIHKSITPQIKFENKKTLGTFVDFCVKKIINKDNHSPLEYLKTCSIYEDLPENIQKITDDYELMKKIISPDFENIVRNKFISLMNNEMICGKFVFNTSLKIHGEPDIITNDTIIDIKIEDKISKPKNYLQIILYAIMCDVDNICIYNPLKGDIAKMKIKDNVYTKMIKYHNEQMNNYSFE